MEALAIASIDVVLNDVTLRVWREENPPCGPKLIHMDRLSWNLKSGLRSWNPRSWNHGSDSN